MNSNVQVQNSKVSRRKHRKCRGIELANDIRSIDNKSKNRKWDYQT